MKIKYTVRSLHDYDYAIVPVMGSVEGNYIISSISTCFRGLFITERNKFISTKLEVDINSQRQRKPTAVTEPYARKYPFVITNGIINYKSGNLSAVWAKFDKFKTGFDVKKSWKHREKVNDFLYDGIPKLIKYEDGRMWLASISSDNIGESSVVYNSPIKTVFDWTEIGDCDSGKDLYKYNFIDVNGGTENMEISITDERLSRLEHYINILKDTKADNLIFNDLGGTLQLSANEKPIGDIIDLETPFGKEIVVEMTE